MTALDQAFFKAYRQQGPVTPGSGEPVSLADVLEDRPLREASEASAAARHDGVIAALGTIPQRAPVVEPPKPAREEPSEEPPDAPTADDSPLGESRNRVPDFLRPPAPKPELKDEAPSRPTAIELLTPEEGRHLRVDQPDGEHVHGHVAAAPSHEADTSSPPEPDVSLPEPDAAASAAPPAPPTAADAETTEPPATATSVVEQPASDGSSTFLPMLQVDEFEWPRVCLDLANDATDALDELTAAMRGLARGGQKVVGLAAARPRQGTTTLLLTSARHLAGQGISVAMVDAASSSPQLARRLRVAPEFGWEQLADDALPLEEYVIESAADSIALLPLCREIGNEARQPELLDIFGQAVDELRRHYELVLLDLGTLSTEPPLGDESAAARREWSADGDNRPLADLDPLVLARAAGAVLLVRDSRRAAAESGSGTLHRRLARAGVTVAGTVETFVNLH